MNTFEFKLYMLLFNDSRGRSPDNSWRVRRHNAFGCRSDLGEELTLTCLADLWALVTKVTFGFKGPVIVGTNPVSNIINIGGNICINLSALFLSLSKMSC
jgi:hypothetical protein